MSKFRFDNMDAGESAFFSRQLEHIRAGSYDVQFAELLARSFVPVDNSVNPGAEVVTYRTFEEVGKAEMASDYSKRAPRADIFGIETTTLVRGVVASYGYSIQEARAAKMAGMPLDSRKATAARRAIEQEIDSVFTIGAAWGGGSLKGLANQANAITFTPTVTVWENNTPTEIIAELHGIAHKIVNDSLGVEVPDTLLLPLSTYNLIASTRMGDGSDATILRFFLGTSPYIKTVAPWHKLESAVVAGLPGAWTGKRMICYKRDPMKLQAIMPQEFEQLAPQYDGFEVLTFCHARTGGVVSYYPKSIAYGDNI